MHPINNVGFNSYFEAAYDFFLILQGSNGVSFSYSREK